MSNIVTLEKTENGVLNVAGAKALSYNEMVTALSRCNISTAKEAALFLSHATKACDFMAGTIQKAVNQDFASEVPAYKAGQDINGVDLALDVRTREKYKKISKALAWGSENAEAI